MAWLSQSVEHETLNFRVMSASPTWGVEPKNKYIHIYMHTYINGKPGKLYS